MFSKLLVNGFRIGIAINCLRHRKENLVFLLFKLLSYLVRYVITNHIVFCVSLRVKTESAYVVFESLLVDFIHSHGLDQVLVKDFIIKDTSRNI